MRQIMLTNMKTISHNSRQFYQQYCATECCELPRKTSNKRTVLHVTFSVKFGRKKRAASIELNIGSFHFLD